MVIRSSFMVGLKEKITGKKLNGFAFAYLAFVKNDAQKHTVEHEKVHIKQFWEALFKFKRLNRYERELEAYIVSVENGRDLNSAAWVLAKYHLAGYPKAFEDLQKGLNK